MLATLASTRFRRVALGDALYEAVGHKLTSPHRRQLQTPNLAGQLGPNDDKRVIHAGDNQCKVVGTPSAGVCSKQ